MKIVIITLGSRGDVQPVAALGRGLKAAGNNVVIATHSNFKEFVEKEGLIFGDIGANAKEVLGSKQGQNWLKSTNPVSLIKNMREAARPLLVESIQKSLEICRGADLIISVVMAVFIGPYIASELNIRHIQAYLQPYHPTVSFNSLYFPYMPPVPVIQKIYNIVSAKAVLNLLWYFFKSTVFDAVKQVFGKISYKIPLIKILYSDPLILYGYSSHVIPKPDDWSSSIIVTGYWFLNHKQSWKPDKSLIDFINNDSPPYYIGFGSMIDSNSIKTNREIISAFSKCKTRVIFTSGWNDFYKPGINIPENVKIIKSVPHDWLFPKMAGIIHHGGAGTTAAGLRAGIPACIVPFFDDQPFWGNIVYRLGIGPKPLPHKKLNAGRLIKLINTMDKTEIFSKNAKELSGKINKEDGVSTAVNAIMSL